MKTTSTSPGILWIAAILLFCSFFSHLQAQIDERLYRSDYTFAADKKGELRFEIDNISFFKNNEFAGDVMPGYSLPGMWVLPKFGYFPLPNIKLELGAHLLFYHGAQVYPAVTYTDIADWRADDYQYFTHLRPWFRAQMKLTDELHLILGNIYGGANHRLIEPLYNAELNYTADPETGLQLLYDKPRLHLDAWLNWQSFIFRNDVHQEVFTVGLSSRFLFNAPSSPIHLYAPIQVMAQHRGGEIDTLYDNSVQTLMNGAAGLGISWNNPGLVRNITFEADAVGHWQQAGKLWPHDTGYALYTRATADIKNIRIKAAYWWAKEFVSMFGLPLYGVVSTKHEGATFNNPRILHGGFEYSRTFAKGFALGIDVDIYHKLSDHINRPLEGWKNTGAATSFNIGIYARINPSFLLKRF